MSLLLPPRGSEVRDMIDVEALANRQWSTYQEARASARRTFAAATPGSIRWINYQVIRADGTIQLLGIGPKGGVKVIWTFGKV